MHHDILDVIKNIQDLYENNSALAVLKDFERVVDELDLYVYKNWIDGELAYGPKVERHWITVGFMWPRDKMPDPVGAKRLTELGCKVLYQKSHLIEPRKIRTPDDIRPNTKKGKLDHHPIWIVEIQMPKKVAFDVFKGYMSKMKENYQDDIKPTESTAPVGAPITPPPMAGGMPPGGAAPVGGAPETASAPGGIPA
jgi:hypothetical protein